MMWWGHGGWGPGAWVVTSLLMLIFWAMIIAAAVVMVHALRGRGDAGTGVGVARDGRAQRGRREPADDAWRILDERFARGELTEEEYIRRRDLLGSR